METTEPITHWLLDGTAFTHVKASMTLAAVERETDLLRVFSTIRRNWAHVVVINRNALPATTTPEIHELPGLLARVFGGFSSCRLALVAASEHVRHELRHASIRIRSDHVQVQVFADLPSAAAWINARNSPTVHRAPHLPCRFFPDQLSTKPGGSGRDRMLA